MTQRWKVGLSLIALVILAGAGWGLYVTWLAGEFKTLEWRSALACQSVPGVPGPEDIVITPDGRWAFISSDDRRATMAGRARPGAILRYDLAAPAARPEVAATLPDFHPHGLGYWSDGPGQGRLFAVNHPGGAGQAIEVFDVAGGTLTHVRSWTDPVLVSPNDVAPAGPDKIYVSNDHGAWSGVMRQVEDYGRLALANVVYLDPTGGRIVADGLRYANGLMLTPGGFTLYVAATTDFGLYVYDREAQTGTLRRRAFLDLGTGPDNLDLDAEGRIWVAAHPKLLTFVAHSKDETRPAPSEVFYLIPGAGLKFQRRRVMLDDGGLVAAASVAAAHGDRVLVGSVFGAGFLDCRVKS